MEEEYFWGETKEGPGPCFYFHESGLDHVRNWIRKQRFIPCDLSDDFIQRFLDATGQNVESAKKMIRRYFYLRQEEGPIFRDRNPSSPINQNQMGSLYAIPVRNPFIDGETVLLTGLLRPATKYSMVAHLKLIALTVDYLLWDAKNKFTDFKILMNGENFPCPALLEKPPSEIQVVARRFQRSLPVNFRGFYLYCPPEHLKEITRIHDGIWLRVMETPEEVALNFPSTILPFEFGGSLGHLNELLDTWNLQMKRRSKFLVEFERRMVNDYRRRLCHEREVREGGKNWVSKMKLYSDESEYKKRYYERMADLKPMYHPAFGKERQRNKPKSDETVIDPLKKMRMLANEEESEEMFPKVTSRYRTSAEASEMVSCEEE